MREYTFYGVISTMTFTHSGNVSVYADSEEDARDYAQRTAAREHRTPLDCVRIKELVKVSD